MSTEAGALTAVGASVLFLVLLAFMPRIAARLSPQARDAAVQDPPLPLRERGATYWTSVALWVAASFVVRWALPSWVWQVVVAAGLIWFLLIDAPRTVRRNNEA